MDDYCRRLEQAVVAAQNSLAAYLEPDSGITASEAISNVLAVLDDAKLTAAMRERGAFQKPA
jgi:hypothetical protein